MAGSFFIQVIPLYLLGCCLGSCAARSIHSSQGQDDASADVTQGVMTSSDYMCGQSGCHYDMDLYCLNNGVIVMGSCSLKKTLCTNGVRNELTLAENWDVCFRTSYTLRIPADPSMVMVYNNKQANEGQEDLASSSESDLKASGDGLQSSLQSGKNDHTNELNEDDNLYSDKETATNATKNKESMVNDLEEERDGYNDNNAEDAKDSGTDKKKQAMTSTFKQKSQNQADDTDLDESKSLFSHLSAADLFPNEPREDPSSNQRSESTENQVKESEVNPQDSLFSGTSWDDWDSNELFQDKTAYSQTTTNEEAHLKTKTESKPNRNSVKNIKQGNQAKNPNSDDPKNVISKISWADLDTEYGNDDFDNKVVGKAANGERQNQAQKNAVGESGNFFSKLSWSDLDSEEPFDDSQGKAENHKQHNKVGSSVEDKSGSIFTKVSWMDLDSEKPFADLKDKTENSKQQNRAEEMIVANKPDDVISGLAWEDVKLEDLSDDSESKQVSKSKMGQKKYKNGAEKQTGSILSKITWEDLDSGVLESDLESNPQGHKSSHSAPRNPATSRVEDKQDSIFSHITMADLVPEEDAVNNCVNNLVSMPHKGAPRVGDPGVETDSEKETQALEEQLIDSPGGKTKAKNNL